jgi:hypothetical protein
MGYGNYSHDAHRAIVEGRSSLPAEQVFVQTQCHPSMNPFGVRMRESRDSVEHPNSLGIVFALDVTGSMGDIPKQLATKELPTFMRLLSDFQVSDPQVLFMAVGDAVSDQAPLQVGQFETTAELMDRWLTLSFLEGGGGGTNHESYELALYFLAEHTDMDCFTKRKKRGYAFLTGDEYPYAEVSKHQVEALFGDALDDNVPLDAVMAAVQETFDPFFLIPDLQRRDKCEAGWRPLLGDRVICMESPHDTCAVAAGLVALTEGSVSDVDALARALRDRGFEKQRINAIVRCLSPYAGTLGKDAVAVPRAVPQSTNPVGSFWKRLFQK